MHMFKAAALIPIFVRTAPCSSSHRYGLGGVFFVAPCSKQVHICCIHAAQPGVGGLRAFGAAPEPQGRCLSECLGGGPEDIWRDFLVSLWMLK